MKKITVCLQYETDNIEKIGTLIENKNRFYFEYDSKFLDKKINISPFKLKLEKGLQENIDNYPKEIFGVFNDSLPDGWGMLLMDRFFRKNKIDIYKLNSLDRLSYIADKTMGALTYFPANNIKKSKYKLKNEIDLYKLSKNSKAFLLGKSEDVLPIMAKAGGSPGGARPKILVGYDGENLISGEGELPENFEHWLIKFNSKNDKKDSGKIEFAYYQMAQEAKLNISKSKLFFDHKGNSYFGTKRFDRKVCNKRVHIHSLANLIHADFRVPSMDYEIFMKVNSILTKNNIDIVMGFRIMIFNIFSYNRDDHSKNFSYIMNKDGIWRLAPAYDLTFSTGPGGEHSTTVAGEGKSPSLNDIKNIGIIAGISEKVQNKIIEEVRTAISTWRYKASELLIAKDDILTIEKHHQVLRSNL